MAKPLLLRVLRDTFGHLIEGLESDNLQVAVWSGEIHLENLSLKKDALDAFQDLPLEIKIGRIKSLKISIPWTRLGSEPVKIIIDGVYALVVLKPTPASTSNKDASSSSSTLTTSSDYVKRRSQREKVRMLRWASLTEDQELLHRAHHSKDHDKDDHSQQPSASTEEDAGFWSKLFSKVVDNLEVEVHNIHVRIEDHACFTSRSFCAGVSIASFSAMTCDANKRRAFVDQNRGSTGLLYRMVRCGNVAVYWDPPPAVPVPEGKSDDFWIGFLHASEFSSSSSSSHHNQQKHHYVLKPCSPSVFVTKNDLPTVDRPRWEFEVTLEGVHLALTQTQYQDVVSVHLALESQIVKSSQSRPVLSVSRNPRAWWRYAIQCTVRDLRAHKQRSGWLSLCRRVVLRERYVGLYKRTKKKPWMAPLTEHELGEVKRIEDELELNDILAFRATAVAQVRAEETKGNLPLVASSASSSSNEQGKASWLRSFLGGGGGDAASATGNKKFELTQEEKAEIQRAIDYLEASQKTRVPEQTLNMVLRSSLKNATLSLVGDDVGDGVVVAGGKATTKKSREILHLRAAGELVIETCVGPSMKTSFHLVAFELEDRFNPDSIFPVLISPKSSSSSSSSSSPVMTLTFEVKPHGKPEDVAVSVAVVPFKIILVPSWVGAVSRFFVIPEEARLLADASRGGGAGAGGGADDKGGGVAEALEDKQDDLMEALARRTLISFRLEVDKPVLICPLMVTRARNAPDYPCVVLGLERLLIESDDFRLKKTKQQQQSNVEEADEAAVDDADVEEESLLAIDAWKLHSKNARAFLVPAQELLSDHLNSNSSWFSDLDETDSRVLFHDFGFDARLAVCITPKLLNLPKTQLSISTSALVLKAPPSLFQFASKLGASWSKSLAGSSSSKGGGSATTPPPLPLPATADPAAPSASSTPPAESTAAAPPGPPLFLVELSVAALITTLSTEHKQDLARLELTGFSMKHSRQANGDVDSTMFLHSLEVLDLFSATPPVLATSMLAPAATAVDGDDGGDTGMISITVLYRQHGTFVDANFHQLHVNWNPETVSQYTDAYHYAAASASASAADESVVAPPPPAPSAPPTTTATTAPLPKTTTKPLKVQAALNTFTLAMCKGSEGRVLAQCVMSRTRLELTQQKRGQQTFNFWLGNFQTIQQQQSSSGASFEFFSANRKEQEEDLFAFRCIRPSAEHDGATYMGVSISPARLVYANQMMLELADYVNQGVMGAIVTKAKDKLTTRTGERFHIEMDWSQPHIVLPSNAGLLETYPAAGVELVCERILMSNVFVRRDEEDDGGSMESQMHVEARNVDLVAFDSTTATMRLLKSAVGLELDITSPLRPQPTYVVRGQVSPIEIQLNRQTYFLLHRILKENLLAEPPSAVAAAATAPSTATVKYGYDQQGPPTKFDVALGFSSASLQIAEHAGGEIATFAMRDARLELFRLASVDPTTMQLAVQVLDLVDDRPSSRTRCFRHLILCSNLAAVANDEQQQQQQAAARATFEVKFVSALGLIEVNLNMFRSVVLLDLFFHVLNFITTTAPDAAAATVVVAVAVDDEEEDELLHQRRLQARSPASSFSSLDSSDTPPADGSPPASPALRPATSSSSPPPSPGWKGTFRLRQASMYFVADLDDPHTQCVVLGGDLDLEWIKSPSGCSSTWKGRIPNYELYRASMPRAQQNASDLASALALLEELVGHQITEPSEVSFEYAYEFDSPLSKIHSRRFIFQMEQLENFLSITDLQTVLAVKASLARGDAGNRTSTPGARREHVEFVAGECSSSVEVWPGLKTDRPSTDAFVDVSASPSSLASKRRMRREQLAKRRFTVEFRVDELGLIEFTEHEGFVCVGQVARPSLLAGLVEPGDVLVAVNYTPVLTKSLSAILSVLTEEKKQLALQQQQQQAPADPSSSSRGGGGGAVFSLSFHAATCTLPLVLKDSVQFESKAIMLHLIDDIDGRDLPLVHVSFTKIDAFRNASNVAGKTTVMGANVLLAMHFHDAISGKWAMLMSPWTANLVVQWHSHGQIEAQFDTENDLQFQLSDVFVRAATNATRRFKQLQITTSEAEAKKKEEDEEKEKIKPPPPAAVGAILLRNRTGLPMWYRPINEIETAMAAASSSYSSASSVVSSAAGDAAMVGGGGDAQSYLEGICILPEQTASLTFAHEHGSGAGTRRSYHRRDRDRVLVSFGPQWNREWEIHANVVHRGAITLEAVAAAAAAAADSDDVLLLQQQHQQQHQPQPPTIRVCWEVNLDDGRLCLELRSFRQVCNRLRHPIQVFAKNPRASTFTVTRIAPGDTVSLPVVSGEVTELRFRPLLTCGTTGEQSDYHWSEACYVELASQRGSSNVTCAPPGPSATATAAASAMPTPRWKPFLLHVQAEIQHADGATILFTVYPPIVVQNQLPSALMCRFFYERRAVGNDVSLDAGGCSHIHAVTVEGSNSYVAFRLPFAKEWTNVVRVERKRKLSSATPLRGGGDGSSSASSSQQQQQQQQQQPAAVSKRVEEIIQLNIVDGDGSVVPLSVVQETTEYEGIRFIVFCTHWLVNKTNLPLSYGYAQNKWSNSTAHRQASSCPPGVMMFTNPEESGGKLQVRVSAEAASAPFSVSTPDGKARQIVVPGGPAAQQHSFDLSVSVDVGPGDLYRTNVVTFAPRYLFVNRLPQGTVLLARQLWEDLSVKTAAPVLQVDAGAREPFWASAHTRSRPFRLQIRCKSTEFETTWSNPFVLEKVQQGRAVVFVELNVANSRDVFRFNMEVREDQLAGCIDVDVSEWVQAVPPPPPPSSSSAAAGEEQQEEEEAPAAPRPAIAVPPTPLAAHPAAAAAAALSPILPKTQVKFEFPKVEVILRRDVAAKQKIRAAPPPPPPASAQLHHQARHASSAASVASSTSSSSSSQPLSRAASSTFSLMKRVVSSATTTAGGAAAGYYGSPQPPPRPNSQQQQPPARHLPPPPPPPPPQPRPQSPRRAHGASSASSVSSSTSTAVAAAATVKPISRANGVSTEIARLIVIRSSVTLSQRVDHTRELILKVYALRVLDTFPGAPFPDPCDGRNEENPKMNFLSLHVIQKNSNVFERFYLRIPGLKLKVDERFVLDLAQFAHDTVLKRAATAAAAASSDGSGSDEDCALLIADILSTDRASKAADSSSSSGNNAAVLPSPAASSLIFFNSFYISGMEIRLWYHQARNSSSSSSSSAASGGGAAYQHQQQRPLVNFGILSKFNIKIANSKIKFNALSLVRPFGSQNLYLGIIKDHYETEARSQLGSMLFSAFDFSTAPLVLADTIITKILGTEVKSKEFAGTVLTNDDMVTRYRRRLVETTSLDQFVRDVVRNCVFDWSYNHTGWLNSRKAIILGVVNKSDHEVTVSCSLVVGNCMYVLPGGLASRQLSNETVRIVPGAPMGGFDPSSTCLVIAGGFLSENVVLMCKSGAFTARFDHVDHTLKSGPGFSAAFLAKDTSNWLSWYVLVIENQVQVVM